MTVLFHIDGGIGKHIMGTAIIYYLLIWSKI